MTLYIDGTDFKNVSYALAGSSIVKRTFAIDPHESQEILTNLAKFLKFSKIKPEDIKKIIVNKGPGSFTGTRVGVTHALALGFAWNVLVRPLEKSKFERLLSK